MSRPNASSLKPFYYGTLQTQLANNALQVTMPLVLLHVSESAASTGYIMTAVSLANALGTLGGGALFNLTSARVMLSMASAMRAFFLFVLSFRVVSGAPGVMELALLYALDNAMLGVLDTARYAVPTAAAGHDREAINAINARYQLAFEVGTTLGPFLAGAVLVAQGLSLTTFLSPLIFLSAALTFMRFPSLRAHSARRAPSRSAFDELKEIGPAIRSVVRKPAIRKPFFILLSLQYYRIKALYAALFAEIMLRNGAHSAWLVGMFGVGGVIGSLAYGTMHHRASPAWWLKISALGLGLFSMAWWPARLDVMMAAIFVLVATNVFSRLSIQSLLQSRLSLEEVGTIMGANRFLVKLSDAGMRALIGLAFGVSAHREGGFFWISAALIGLALIHLWAARTVESAD